MTPFSLLLQFRADFLVTDSTICCDGLQNAVAVPPAAAPKPVARKPVLKAAPRSEQAAKADENRKQPEGAAHKLPRKKVVNTLTAVMSHRSKVSSIDPTALPSCTAPLHCMNE
jgi:hypothetical protein